jgi:hypothetical protein
MTTHEFNNQASQSERREVLRNDTYFARQQNTADDAGGRFTKLTPSNLTGQSQQVPQLPASSPWANGFDVNVEPQLGFAVDEMPANETQTPALNSPEVHALPAAVEDHVGERVVSVVSPLSTQATRSLNKRRKF